MPVSPPFSVIVATDAADGIGKAGDLPWRLPADLKHFKRTTVGAAAGTNAVIMGRVTWQSIPDRFRPLPDRQNVVLSRQAASLPLPEHVWQAHSLDAALAATADHAERWVIGGAGLYEAALVHVGCERLVITRIASTFACDTFLPPLPRGEGGFVLSSRGEAAVSNGLRYHIEEWTRP